MMLEVGIQNGALAFFIAVNLLKDMSLVAPATVYTVAMILVALPIVLLRRASLRA
jgi:predicted Na+-dependent transporter